MKKSSLAHDPLEQLKIKRSVCLRMTDDTDRIFIPVHNNKINGIFLTFYDPDTDKCLFSTGITAIELLKLMEDDRATFPPGIKYCTG